MAAWQWVFAFVPHDPFMVKGPMPSAMPPPPPGALDGRPPPGFSTPLTPSMPVSTEPMKGDAGDPQKSPKTTLGPVCEEIPKKTVGPVCEEIPKKTVGNVKEIKTDPPLLPKAEPTKPPMAPGSFFHGPVFPAPPPFWPRAGEDGPRGKGHGKKNSEIMEVIEVEPEYPEQHVPRHVRPRPKCRPIEKTTDNQSYERTEEHREKVVTSSTKTMKREEEMDYTNPPKRWKPSSSSDSWKDWSWKDYETPEGDDGDDYDGYNHGCGSKWYDYDDGYYCRSWGRKWSSDTTDR